MSKACCCCICECCCCCGYACNVLQINFHMTLQLSLCGFMKIPKIVKKKKHRLIIMRSQPNYFEVVVVVVKIVGVVLIAKLSSSSVPVQSNLN